MLLELIKVLNFPRFLENEVLLNVAYLLFFLFILLKISNILTGCYKEQTQRYASLIKRVILPTRYIDENALNA